MASDDGIALITGAGGGIGRACALRIGAMMPVFLADRDADMLAMVAAECDAGGTRVAGTHCGNLAVAGAPLRLLDAARARGRLTAIVHAAGLSPALAGAEAIIRVNAAATEALLTAAEQQLDDAPVAVVIASMAGHVAAPDARIDPLCAGALGDDDVARLLGLLAHGGTEADKATGQRHLAAAAYAATKRANILAVQRRATAWGRAGARIVSISPGLVDTSMGRREVDADVGAAAMLAMQPLGWVAPDDIAATAAFLISDAARAITGCDIRVDGGLTGALFAGRTTSGACAA